MMFLIVTNIADTSGNISGYEGGNRLIEYDANGNMTKMPDKGITNIAYNFLNLPSQITQPNTTQYLYRADGVKLKKTYTINNATGSNIINTEYLDGFQYVTNSSTFEAALQETDDQTLSAKTAGEEEVFVSSKSEANVAPIGPGSMKLSFFPTAEGFYDYGKKQYIYQYKDHLGNVRLSYTKNTDTNTLDILDRNDYYPFGMNFMGYLSVFDAMGSGFNYKMQEQELQETGFYAYKWRQYMPDVARFFNIDPLSEKYAYQSHYNFSENRVIDGRELEGLEWSGIHYKNNDGSQQIDYTVNYKVLNSSQIMTADDVKIRMSEIVKQVETSFSGRDSEGIIINTKVGAVDIVNNVGATDYYIDFVDDIGGASSPLTIGRVDEIGNSQINRIQVHSALGSDSGEVAGHEIGHTVGLRHQISKDPQNSPEISSSMGATNMMNSSSNGTVLSPQQLNSMQQNIPTNVKIETNNNNYVTPISDELKP